MLIAKTIIIASAISDIVAVAYCICSLSYMYVASQIREIV